MIVPIYISQMTSKWDAHSTILHSRTEHQLVYHVGFRYINENKYTIISNRVNHNNRPGNLNFFLNHESKYSLQRNVLHLARPVQEPDKNGVLYKFTNRNVMPE